MQEKNTLAAQTELLFKEAYAFHQNGDLENAIVYYRKTAQIDPYHFVIHYNMGAAQYGLKKIDDAINSFNSAIHVDPDNVMPYYDLGNIYINQKRFVQAILCYVKAIQIKPDFADAHNNLDVVLNTIDSPQLSITTYKKMMDQNRNIFDVGPQRIRIETSGACNLRCQHCPTGVDYKGTDRSIMSMETFEKILDQIKQFKIVHDSVLYLGGEPLMNKNFPLMCQRIKEETMITRTLFNTNAMLLNEENCKELSKANVDKIDISIDGRSPKENNQIRKGADYATVSNNAKMLKRFLPNVQIAIANTQIKRQGDPETPVPPDFLVNDFPDDPIECTYAMQWPGLNFNKSSLKNISLTPGPKKNFCKMPFTEMTVRSNGDVIVCCYDILGQHVLGNIHDSDLLSIWKGEDYKIIRETLLSQDVEDLPGICKKCVNFTGHIPVIKDE